MLVLSDLSWMQVQGILERVRNRLLEIHGCVSSRWLGRSVLGVQLMHPTLDVAFSALQQLSPEGKGEMGAGTRSLGEQQLQPSGVGVRIPLLKALFLCDPRIWLLLGSPVSVFQGSAVCVVWAGLEEGGFVSPLVSPCSACSPCLQFTVKGSLEVCVCVACHQNQVLTKSGWNRVYNK